MPSEMENRQAAIVQEFEAISDWDARYQHIMALGKTLSPMEVAYKTEAFRVQGCQSQVWMHASINKAGRVQFQAESDALIVKGLVALLLRVYNDLPPADILNTEPHFMEVIGLGNHLSMTRRNGLAAMLKQMRLYAMAFQLQAQG